MAGDLTHLSREYGDAPTHAAARATLSPDAPTLPGENPAQQVQRLMAPALVGQGAASAHLCCIRGSRETTIAPATASTNSDEQKPGSFFRG